MEFTRTPPLNSKALHNSSARALPVIRTAVVRHPVAILCPLLPTWGPFGAHLGATLGPSCAPKARREGPRQSPRRPLGPPSNIESVLDPPMCTKCYIFPIQTPLRRESASPSSTRDRPRSPPPRPLDRGVMPSPPTICCICPYRSSICCCCIFFFSCQLR